MRKHTEISRQAQQHVLAALAAQLHLMSDDDGAAFLLRFTRHFPDLCG